MFNITSIFNTPLTGASQIPVNPALTKGRTTATTLVGSAWTWVPFSFIAPIDVEPVATGPSPASLRLLAARPIVAPIISNSISEPVSVIRPLFLSSSGALRAAESDAAFRLRFIHARHQRKMQIELIVRNLIRSQEKRSCFEGDSSSWGSDAGDHGHLLVDLVS